MKLWTAALAVLLAGSLVGVAEARGGRGNKGADDGAKRHGGGVSLSAADANGDKEITKDEWEAEFAKLDKNGDGKLTADELQGGADTHAKGKKGGRKNR